MSDTAALVAALKIAQPGDVIALAPGRYDDVRLSKINIAGEVTVTSHVPGRPAEIAGLAVDASSGVTFRGLTVISDPADGDRPNVVSDSARIAFDQVHFHGSLNKNPGDDTGGLQFRGSTDVSVTNSTFEQLFWGVSHLDNTRLKISGNEFHDLRADGIRGGGSSYVEITGNSFRDFFINPGDHGDVIQFWTTNTTASAHDILVADNLFVRGDGYFVQGICFRDEKGDLPYERVVIRGNMLAGSTYNAITIDHGRDVTVEGNVVQAFADRKSYMTLANVERLTVTDNASMLLRTTGSTDVVETGTRLIPMAGDGGAASVQAWLSARVTTLAGGLEDDILLGGTAGAVIRGGEGRDVLRGSANFDDINGNQGDDTAFGGSGDDWVLGGKDNDLLSGDAGNDLVYGNLGADTCDGGAGSDTVRGGQQDDVLRGGDGADYLSGDKDNDTLTGGAGADTFHSFGGAGVDRITDFSLAEGDRVVLDAGTTYTLGQVGADTVIDMGGGGQVVLVGVSMSSLTGSWLTFG